MYHGDDVAADCRRHKAHLHVLAEGKSAVMIAAEGEVLRQSRLNQGDDGDVDHRAVAVGQGGEVNKGDQPADRDGVGWQQAAPERYAVAADQGEAER